MTLPMYICVNIDTVNKYISIYIYIYISKPLGVPFGRKLFLYYSFFTSNN